MNKCPKCGSECVHIPKPKMDMCRKCGYYTTSIVKTVKDKNKGVHFFQVLAFIIFSIPFIYFLKYLTKYNYLIGFVISFLLVLLYIYSDRKLIYKIDKSGIPTLVTKKGFWFSTKHNLTIYLTISIILIIIILLIELIKWIFF